MFDIILSIVMFYFTYFYIKLAFNLYVDIICLKKIKEKLTRLSMKKEADDLIKVRIKLLIFCSVIVMLTALTACVFLKLDNN